MDLEIKRKKDAFRQRKKKNKARNDILNLLGNRCKICGYFDQRALCIDHKEGNGRIERRLAGGNIYSFILNKIQNGSKEYQILCSNCNMIKQLENQERPQSKYEYEKF